jgi:NRAMP (natural resistance-associated macrophage protein)-like metal ion transporter
MRKSFWKKLGPGLITGAADDDPSGIATYSQTGSQFGYGQLWTALFTLPLMVSVQEACARIGMVTGKGIVSVMKEHFNKKIVFGVVILVLIANTINIGADIGAMAAALELIVPINFTVAMLLFTILILILEIFTSYKTYSKILKWLTLSLVSYVLTAIIINEPWGEILKATFIPHIEFNFAFLFIIVGVLGTTISPYMFFWEADEEVEEERQNHLIGKDHKPKISWQNIKDMRTDNFTGMIFSNIVTWCIIVTTATVLHFHGVTDIKTSADAAKALEPLVSSFPYAGTLAKIIFSVGIIGLGLLAVPVLSASASYAVSEALDWRASLNYKLKRAHGFYAWY